MFIKRVETLCQEKNTNPSRMMSELGFSNATFTGWKQRGTSPSGENLARIADYFGVSVDYLLGRTELRQPAPAAPVSPFPADAVEVARAYAMLPSLEQKNMIRGSLHLPPIASAQAAG